MPLPRLVVFGRANRVTYWTWFTALLVLSVALSEIRLGSAWTDFAFALLFAPRLHDVGRSGLWGIALTAAYTVFEAFAVPGLPPKLVFQVEAPVSLLFFGLVVVLGVWRGQSAVNKFGDPPPARVESPFARQATKGGDPDGLGVSAPTDSRVGGSWVMVSGRANRATYWAWLIGAIVFLVALGFLHVELAPGFTLSIAAYFIAVCGPRLRDIGRSGWWAAGVILGLVVSILVLALVSNAKLLPMPAAVAIFALVLFLPIAALIPLGAWPGNPGDNRFGSRPRRGVANLFARQGAPEQDVAEVFS